MGLAKIIKDHGVKNVAVKMGAEGCYLEPENETGTWYPVFPVKSVDTTGAGDSFFAGIAIGLTYGKTLAQACKIGTRLAASVIATKENVCPRFLPEEFELEV